MNGTHDQRRRRSRSPIVGLATLGIVAASCTPAWSPHPNASSADRYVSLGDSWVSGPLIGRQVGDPIDCGRSDENFPSLIAQELDVTAFTDVSCGGGDTEDLFKPGKANLGGRTAPQFDALRADTTLVTVGMGGNDAKISSLALKCVNVLPIPLGPPPFGQPCVERFTAGGVDQISAKIAATRPKIEKALAEIHRRSPVARVYVLGYGAALPDTGDGCWPSVPVLAPDVSFIRSKMKEINTMLAEVAAASGDHFVDLWSMTTGHDMCQPRGQSWLNAVSLDPAGIPGHPNILYHHNVAPLIAAQMRGDIADPKN